jgi:hypothetical protein
MKEVEQAPSTVVQFPKDRITNPFVPRPGEASPLLKDSPEAIAKIKAENKAAVKRLQDKKKDRVATADELEDYINELDPTGETGVVEEGMTIRQLDKMVAEQKAYEAAMYRDYKAGKLDPTPGDKSPARKRFLEKKLEEMELSGDKRLMTRDEIEELSSFDLGTEMDEAIKKSKTLTPEEELRREFPGIDDRLIKNILADTNPQRIAEVKQTMREALKMQEKGMSPDEIIKLFKDTTRTKQASGGIAGQLHLYDGGRARFDKGKKVDLSKRRFLKGTGATLGVLSMLPFVGKFFKAAKPISKAVTPAAEVITRGADGIPSYAWDLINVVKAKGTKEIMEGIYKRNPPSVKYNYKGVEVVDDGTGGVSVNKQQTKTGQWTDQGSDKTIVDDYVDREIGFEIRKGETVTNKKGKQIQTADEYNESTAYMQGEPEGGMDVSEVLDYIDEADHLDFKKIADESLIKKASGGRVSLSKGGLAKILGV